MSIRFAWAVVLASACHFEMAPDQVPGRTDLDSGRHVAPGEGRMFVLMVLTATTTGFDLDGACARGERDCTDRALELGGFDRSLHSDMIAANPAFLVEIAGADAAGLQDRASINFYLGADGNDVREDNFLPIEYSGSCCEYRLDPDALEGVPPEPRWSIAAVGRNDRFVSVRPGLAFIQHVGYVARSRFFGAEVSGDLALSQIELDVAPGGSITGRLGGAVSIAILHLAAGTDSLRPDRSALEIIVASRQPDVDLDDDGLETLTVGEDGNIAECRDGDDSVVPSPDPTSSELCADEPEMADGFSVAHRFSGVPARVVQ